MKHPQTVNVTLRLTPLEVRFLLALCRRELRPSSRHGGGGYNLRRYLEWEVLTLLSDTLEDVDYLESAGLNVRPFSRLARPRRR
jgi:hypothetical protein